MNNLSERQINDVFLKYVVGDDFKFTKTEVRIELAEYGDVYLVSRFQAKRILARLENFTEVLFDFKNVEKVSPAFADELGLQDLAGLLRIINTACRIDEGVCRSANHL